MRTVEGAREDLEMREATLCGLDDLHGFLAIIDGDDQDSGVGGARGREQILARGIAIKDLEAEAAQRIDLLGIVVEHGRL